MVPGTLLANIDERGKRMRFNIGLLLTDGGVIAACVLMFVPVARWWAGVLFVPFFFGVLCLLQARSHC